MMMMMTTTVDDDDDDDDDDDEKETRNSNILILLLRYISMEPMTKVVHNLQLLPSNKSIPCLRRRSRIHFPAQTGHDKPRDPGATSPAQMLNLRGL